jgi:4'-phosphopantetheinyl transferase
LAVQPITSDVTETPDLEAAVADAQGAGPETVWVWVARLDCAAAADADWSYCLSAYEQQRARRYAFERDRRRFVAARAFLRSVLGAQIGIDPAAIRFQTGPWGKPTLGIDHGLEFNLSHSNEVAVCAVARCRVGIDVEHVRPVADAMQIAGRFFSSAEAAALRRVSEEGLMERFFLCWTRKEAYIKATGEGLSCALDAFTVSIDPNRPALLRAPDDPARWSVVNIPTPAGYIASLVVEQLSCRILSRTWDGWSSSGMASA